MSIQTSIATRNYVFNTGGIGGNIAFMLSSNNDFTLSNTATVIGPTTLSNTLTVSGDIQARSNLYIVNALGVGTSNPSGAVDIIGNTRVTGTFVSSGACIIRKSPGQVNTSNIFQFYQVNGLSNNGSNLYLYSPYGTFIKGTNIISAFTDSNVYISTNVGIGISNPLYPLHVMGHSNNVSIFSQFSVIQSSDARLKTDIVRIQNALHKLQNISGYSYERIDGDIPKKSYGVLAQEIERILPDAVYTHGNEIKAVSYNDLIALLIEAIKDLKKEKDDEIYELRRSITSIYTQLNKDY